MESSIKTLLRKNNSLEWTREIDFYFRKLGIVFFLFFIARNIPIRKKKLDKIAYMCYNCTRGKR